MSRLCKFAANSTETDSDTAWVSESHPSLVERLRRPANSVGFGKHVRRDSATVWRLLMERRRLVFATERAYVKMQRTNPGPSGEDAELSANLAMSDRLCAKAHRSADIRAATFHPPSLADLSSFGART